MLLHCRCKIHPCWSSVTPCSELLSCCSCSIYACWPSVFTATNTAAVKFCCKMDACWTVATQSCLPIVYHSILHVGWCCVSLSAIPSGVVSHYQLCLLMWCLFKGHAFWRGASLSATPVGVVSHYSTCLLMWCLTKAHAFWCGASLSAISAGVVITIGDTFWCGTSLSGMHVGVFPHYRPCLLAWYLTIDHACWAIATATDILLVEEEEWLQV